MNIAIQHAANEPPIEITREPSGDLLSLCRKKYPGIEERKTTKPSNRHVRFFQDVREKAGNLVMRNHQNSKSYLTAGSSDSTSKADDGLVELNLIPDFCDEEALDGFDGYSDDESMSHSKLQPEMTIEEKEEIDRYLKIPLVPLTPPTALKQRGSKEKEKLQVGFGNRNLQRRRIAQSPVGKAFINMKNRILPSKQASPRSSLTRRVRRWSSTQFEHSQPPSWKEYRIIEEELMRTKLEVATIRTDLDHSKARLKRSTAERDWLHTQYATLQREYQESRDMNNEYKTMVHHLRNHVQEASVERTTTLDSSNNAASMEILNSSFSNLGGINHASKNYLMNRSWPSIARVFNTAILEEDES